MPDSKQAIQVIQLNPGDTLLVKYHKELSDAELEKVTDNFAEWLDEIGLSEIHLTVVDSQIDFAVWQAPQTKYKIILEEEDDFGEFLERGL